MRTGWRLVAAAVGAAAVLALAGGAFADTVTRADPKDDVRGVPKGGGFDLKAASAGHDSSGRLVHKVSSHYPDPPGFGAVQVEIDSDSEPGFDFAVRKSGRGAAVYNLRSDRRVAGAVFKRISASTIRLTFRSAVFGNPPRYKWRVRIIGERNRVIDALPNRGSITHVMPRPND